MRLSKEIIKHLSETIAINLEKKQLASFTDSRTSVAIKIGDVITENMLMEDQLNKEVEKILSAHEAEIARGMMDYRKMFELTKQKLARERGIVL
ncbi:MAG: DUF507 family protein [Nitrospirota bacterium]